MFLNTNYFRNQMLINLIVVMKDEYYWDDTILINLLFEVLNQRLAP
jgi:hypothetical protein